MKKIFLTVLAVAIVLSLSVTSFAAPAINYWFDAMSSDGKYYYYMFGTNDKNATEVGVIINGEKYALDGEGSTLEGAGESSLSKAQEIGLFGIAVADPDNILGDSITVTPYEVVDDVTVMGTEYVKSKADFGEYNELSLTELTIGGEAALGFYAGTKETDFYYGFEVLPESAADLPEIAISSDLGRIEKGEVESYYGGYTVPYTARYTNKYGELLEETYKIHFRELKSTTATADFAARRRYGFYEDMTTSGYSGISNTEFGYLSFTFDEDFSQDCEIISSSLSAYFNGAAGEDIYVGVSGFGTKANMEANSSVANVDMVSIAGDVAFDEIGIITPTADLTAEVFSLPDKAYENVAGNEILLVFGKNTSTNATYIWNTTARPADLTVNYVEKTPVDPVLSDYSITGISYSYPGEDEKNFAFDAATTDYYFGVDMLDSVSGDFVTVTTAQTGTVVNISEVTDEADGNGKVITVQATASDGTAGPEYKIHFREIKSVTAAADFIARKRYAYYEDLTASGYASILNSSFGYLSFTFDKDFSQDCEIVSSSLSAYFNGTAGEDIYVGVSGFGTKENLAANASSANVDMASTAGDVAFNKIGVITPTADLTAEVFSLPYKAYENVTGSEILLVLGKNTSANTTYIWNTTARPAALTVYYIEK